MNGRGDDARPERSGDGLRSAAVVAAMAVAGAAIVLSRRPDAVTNPQFWAEDGRTGSPTRTTMGLRPCSGATRATWSRSSAPWLRWRATEPGARRAALRPGGLAIQVAPAAFLMSGRFAHVGPRRARALVALGYLLLPSFELNVTLTNAQWHLAILAVMVLAAAPAKGAVGRGFDLLVLAASGLSGRSWWCCSRRRWPGRSPSRGVVPGMHCSAAPSPRRCWSRVSRCCSDTAAPPPRSGSHSGTR